MIYNYLLFGSHISFLIHKNIENKNKIKKIKGKRRETGTSPNRG